MVIEDLSFHPKSDNDNFHQANPMARFLAGVFDFLLLSPICSFVPALHIQTARMDYAQGYDSAIWFQIAVLALLTNVVLHTLFVYFMKATPGQSIMGLKVKSLNQEMTWNQALIRSFFYTFSWLFAGLPLLEILTHPIGRCWHDRISDTVVLSHRKIAFISLPQNQIRTEPVRAGMIFGFFILILMAMTKLSEMDSMSFTGVSYNETEVDTLVARALLKKDQSEDVRAEIDDKLWNAKTAQEKSLAYFYRFLMEKEKDMQLALSHQICEWKAESLCTLSKYYLDPKPEKMTDLMALADRPIFLSAQVALMKELTRQSKVLSALKVYDKLRKEDALSDELKIWDISLFLKVRDAQRKNRTPASLDPLKKAWAEFEKERGEP